MADNKQPTFVEELVPKGSVREQLYWWQVRRKVRYICFRLQTQYDPEAPDRDAEDMPEGFREFFESQIPEPGEEPKSGQWFDGWENFGKTWDVGGKDSGFAEDKVKNPSERSDSPLVTVPRWTTVWEDNEDEINTHLKVNEIQARKRRRAYGSESNIQSSDQKD